MLREHWSVMMASGSRIEKFEITPASAWRILYPLIDTEIRKRLALSPRNRELKKSRNSIISSCDTLLQRILSHESQKVVAASATVRGDDAQAVVDFIDQELINFDSPSHRWLRIVSLLSQICVSAQVYPQACKVLNDHKFDTSSPIAKDGHATIFKATREEGTKPLRLKVAHSGPQVSTSFFLKIQLMEVALLTHLSHQNVLPFYGVFTDPRSQRLCTVFPWMNNGTVVEYASRTFPKNPRKRLPLIADIIEGLCYLHELNIVHGDLKGTNILVSDDGRALIAELGQANFTLIPINLGDEPPLLTPHWTAPELLDDEVSRRPTKESDIWSFGCVIYEVLTMLIPYSNLTTTLQLIVAHAREEHPRRSGLEDDIWLAVTKCMRFDASARPSCYQARGLIASLEFVNNSFERRARGMKRLRNSGKNERGESPEGGDRRQVEISYGFVHNALQSVLDGANEDSYPSTSTDS
ncbi:Cytokinesis protein sepH [Leucoagaricus sp. SymC.cos]|nr:Cytokinesis protein sepH [Leucoagaricus sp. SymC.cos]